MGNIDDLNKENVDNINKTSETITFVDGEDLKKHNINIKGQLAVTNTIYKEPDVNEVKFNKQYDYPLNKEKPTNYVNEFAKSQTGCRTIDRDSVPINPLSYEPHIPICTIEPYDETGTGISSDKELIDKIFYNPEKDPIDDKLFEINGTEKIEKEDDRKIVVTVPTKEQIEEFEKLGLNTYDILKSKFGEVLKDKLGELEHPSSEENKSEVTGFFTGKSGIDAQEELMDVLHKECKEMGEKSLKSVTGTYVTGEDFNIEYKLQFYEHFDTIINEKYKDKIVKRILENNGYCPCVTEKVTSTLCPCKEYMNSHNCHCNLYIRKPSNIKVWISKENNKEFVKSDKSHPIQILQDIKYYIDNIGENDKTIHFINTNNIIVIDFIFDYILINKRNIEIFLENKLLSNNGGIVEIHQYLDYTREKDIINKIYLYQNCLKTIENKIGNEPLATERLKLQKEYSDSLKKFLEYQKTLTKEQKSKYLCEDILPQNK
jgi:hypothetical protein